MGGEDPWRSHRGGRGAADHGVRISDIEAAFRREARQAVATLIRLLGDIDLAEEAVQEAFVVALERWPADGIPERPGAWITTTARRKGVDRLRREGRRATKQAEAARQEAIVRSSEPANRVSNRDDREHAIVDDTLRLIFTCCHPALAPDAQTALTLRLLGGLTTAEIARAFLVSEATMGQRIVRAKTKIRQAAIPYRVPAAAELPARLPAVLNTIYLIFNEGYAATAGAGLLRTDLCDEAIRLARIAAEALPDEPEVRGLLALLLLHHSRRATRTDANGNLVLLAQQDRSRWSVEDIAAGLAVLPDMPGPYQLQAAIAAEHATAAIAADTNWSRVADLYGQLLEINPTPVIALNRAVAVAEAYGPEAGLQLVDELQRDLDGYYLFHSTRADFLRRLNRTTDARAAYVRARSSTNNETERAFLNRRLQELDQPG